MATTEEQNFDEAWASANGAEPDEVKEEKDQPQTEDHQDKEAVPIGQSDNREDPYDTKEELIDYQSLYEKEKQRNDSWDGRLSKAQKELAEANSEIARLREDAQKRTKVKEPPVDSESDEVLSAFLEEFPDLQAPLQALIKQEASLLLKKELGDIKPQVETIKKTQQQTVRDRHFSTIRKAHPDYLEYVEDGSLEKWIDGKPNITKPALNRIRTEGSADEVVELFNLFKEETGRKSPSAKQIKPGDKQEKLKQAIAVPGSASGPPPEGPDKKDYNSAWDEANKT